MEENLNKYIEQEKILIEEIQNGKYTFEEARDKCNQLYELFPHPILVNPVGLQAAMTTAYPNILDHSHRIVYKIPIDKMTPAEADEYVKNLMEKYGKK